MNEYSNLDKYPDTLGYYSKLMTGLRALELAREMETADPPFPVLAEQYRRVYTDTIRDLEDCEGHFLNEAEHTQRVIEQEKEAAKQQEESKETKNPSKKA